MDAVKEDMQLVGVREDEDAGADEGRWLAVGQPWWEPLKGEEGEEREEVSIHTPCPWKLHSEENIQTAPVKNCFPSAHTSLTLIFFWMQACVCVRAFECVWVRMPSVRFWEGRWVRKKSSFKGS